jgi:hypothetical protein
MLSVWRSVLCVCTYVRMSILLSIAQGKKDQWRVENNLAHLLEYTPGLKTLNLVNDLYKYPHLGICVYARMFLSVFMCVCVYAGNRV